MLFVGHQTCMVCGAVDILSEPDEEKNFILVYFNIVTYL